VKQAVARLLRWSLGLAFGLLSGALSPGAPANILLIISDDHAWTDYGFMGHAQLKTPRLDRLAAESLCFTRGYVTSSLCCPSLASIITGRFPHEHKVVCNDPPRPAAMPAKDFYQSQAFRTGRERLTRFLEETPTLPRLLKAHGYVSFQAGKWWQSDFSRGGFTHGMTHGDEGKGGRHGDAGLEIGRKTLKPIEEFIDAAQREKKPWLVWYAPMMPHDPHTPPERILKRYEAAAPSRPVARYWAMVEWFDETCGQLLDFIEARGLSEETIVVYVADNGWITNPETGRFAPRSKLSPYDGGLRTPILMRWPGRVPARRIEIPVSSVDIAPTLLAAAGAQAPSGLPGIDLLKEGAGRERDSVFGACFAHDGVDLDRPASGLRWRWVVSDGWKLIAPAAHNVPEGKVELFRIVDDPLEMKNLAETAPGEVVRLRERLDAWWEGRP